MSKIIHLNKNSLFKKYTLEQIDFGAVNIFKPTKEFYNVRISEDTIYNLNNTSPDELTSIGEAHLVTIKLPHYHYYRDEIEKLNNASTIIYLTVYKQVLEEISKKFNLDILESENQYKGVAWPPYTPSYDPIGRERFLYGVFS